MYPQLYSVALHPFFLFISFSQPEERCRDMYRPEHEIRLSYQGCISKKELRPRFCNICQGNICCEPNEDKVVDLEFECENKSIKYYSFAWNKSCSCTKSCDKR